MLGGERHQRVVDTVVREDHERALDTEALRQNP
ncbi:hypothetical protein ACVWXO_002939 [Bradyrhizobium sp. LM2.7]